MNQCSNTIIVLRRLPHKMWSWVVLYHKLRRLVSNGFRHFIVNFTNRPFLSSAEPLFQNEGRCSAFDMEMIFHSHANKTHFHKKG